MTEQYTSELQQTDMLPENHDKKYMSIMLFVFFLIAIPLYTVIYQAATRFKNTSYQASQQTAQTSSLTPATPQKFTLPQPTVTPVVISHRQDIDKAIKLLDSTDTINIEQTLQQTSAEAATFSQ